MMGQLITLCLLHAVWVALLITVAVACVFPRFLRTRPEANYLWLLMSLFSVVLAPIAATGLQWEQARQEARNI